MASNNQKCVWVYAIGHELVHYFQTEEEADGWWADYKVEVGDDVEGAIEQVWMFQKPPPPPKEEPSVEDRLTKALADGYKLNGSVVMALMMEAAKPAAKRLREIKEELYEEKKDIVGQCQCCECDVTTDQEYLKLKTGAGAGRIYCEEHVGSGECQKAWSASCGCDVCADEEEEEEEEVEVIQFEYEGKTYWREDEEVGDVFGGEFEEPEEVGEWVGGKIQFNITWLVKLTEEKRQREREEHEAGQQRWARFQAREAAESGAHWTDEMWEGDSNW